MEMVREKKMQLKKGHLTLVRTYSHTEKLVVHLYVINDNVSKLLKKKIVYIL